MSMYWIFTETIVFRAQIRHFQVLERAKGKKFLMIRLLDSRCGRIRSRSMPESKDYIHCFEITFKRAANNRQAFFNLRKRLFSLPSHLATLMGYIPSIHPHNQPNPSTPHISLFQQGYFSL